MVNALVQIEDNINRVLDIIKAKHGLRNKGEAINFVVNMYIEHEAEPELLPEFIEKMKEIERQRSVAVKDFSKRYGLK